MGAFGGFNHITYHLKTCNTLSFYKELISWRYHAESTNDRLIRTRSIVDSKEPRGFYQSQMVAVAELLVHQALFLTHQEREYFNMRALQDSNPVGSSVGSSR